MVSVKRRSSILLNSALLYYSRRDISHHTKSPDLRGLNEKLFDSYTTYGPAFLSRVRFTALLYLIPILISYPESSFVAIYICISGICRALHTSVWIWRLKKQTLYLSVNICSSGTLIEASRALHGSSFDDKQDRIWYDIHTYWTATSAWVRLLWNLLYISSTSANIPQSSLDRTMAIFHLLRMSIIYFNFCRGNWAFLRIWCLDRISFCKPRCICICLVWWRWP